ncbi:MAG: HIT domain-containing protein [Phycisphaerales bacterium]|nr:HIT domain-containing protein [Phycisphaerales bacterium]
MQTRTRSAAKPSKYRNTQGPREVILGHTASDPIGLRPVRAYLLEPKQPQGFAECPRRWPGLTSLRTREWKAGIDGRRTHFALGFEQILCRRPVLQTNRAGDPRGSDAGAGKRRTIMGGHENLWAPWRMTYLRELKRKADDVGWDSVSAGSFLSEYWARPKDDEKNLIVYRDRDGLVLLNRYPYANGHLMAALGEPRPTLFDYDPPQRAAFWKLVEVAFQLMHRTLAPQGINMGINEGKSAGAGLPEHLHAHIVPRWSGDTNFLSVVGQIRVIPEALDEMARQYRKVAGELPH